MIVGMFMFYNKEEHENRRREKMREIAQVPLTPIESISVKPTRIVECPIQIEAKVRHIRIPEHSPDFAIVETQAIHVHVHAEFIIGENHIDPNKWSPLIYNFRHYFGLGHPLGKTFHRNIG
jgi:flavin reductase (DIM6/NTAB) family NADH-FMN oxidoreductase RutF